MSKGIPSARAGRYLRHVGGGQTKGGSLAGGPSALGLSVTGGWLNQKCDPDENQLQDFLTKWSFSAGGGFWGGGGVMWTPGSGTATQIGFYTPGGGGAASYGFQIR